MFEDGPMEDQPEDAIYIRMVSDQETKPKWTFHRRNEPRFYFEILKHTSSASLIINSANLSKLFMIAIAFKFLYT